MVTTSREARILGPSAWASAARRQIAEIARHDRNCLIVGPRSSGRSVLARGIHERSSRHGRPFIPIRCDLLPSHIFSSQVLGCVDGALSATSKATLGAARAADGGTLYLGHVDQLDALSQWELFGFLANSGIRPVGGRQVVPVDVRLIASCSDDIFEAIKLGQFDVDLFDQLSRCVVETVTLNERTEDIPVLAAHFLNAGCSRRRLAEKRLEPSAIDWLQSQEWPGNLGQLRGLIESLVEDGCADSIDHETIRVWLANREGRPILPR